MNSKNIVVIGGGLVGLGTAFSLKRQYPEHQVTLLEKESEVGRHQSSRNSGVLHCGLYYQPGSLKARLAVSGIRQMIRFCREHAIPHDICGKIVLATNDVEEERLHHLEERGKANGLKGVRRLGPEAIGEREPCARGKAALLVPEEGIVDFPAVARKLRERLLALGAAVTTGAEVTRISPDRKRLVIETHAGEFTTDFLINCAGLHADRVARSAGLKPDCQIVPFRGDYFELSESGQRLVKHLIYPVPDPRFPFLGVHFTRMIGGGAEAGPNAVLALKREGYRWSDFSLRDALDTLSFGGFYRFLLNYPRAAIQEILNSTFRSVFLGNLRKLVPEIESSDLASRGASGVRAQALSRDGRPIMDFHIVEAPNQVHVLNAPSPGATASLAIGDYLAEKVIRQWNEKS